MCVVTTQQRQARITALAKKATDLKKKKTAPHLIKTVLEKMCTETWMVSDNARRDYVKTALSIAGVDFD